MIQIWGCITEQHDFRLVLLAFVVCAFGCYTALSVLARARGADGRLSDWRWLTAAAVVAGATVWTTHFVAMLAYRTGLLVGYDLGLTALSIALAMTLTWLAFMVALHYGAPLVGGAIFGIGIGAMHFTGMEALSVPARFHWDVAYLHAALIIGIVLAAVALRVFVRRPDLGGRLTAATILALAIGALHFIAMTALTLIPDPSVAMTTSAVLAPGWLAVAVTAVMAMIILLGVAGSGIDQLLADRAIAETARLRTHVHELENTKRELETTTGSLASALEAAAAGSQAKSQFLATMSHELRTPLNAIIGFSEVISSENFGPLGDPRYKDYVHHVLESGRHLRDLINDILDFSKIDAGRLELQEEEVDLRDTIDSAVHMLSGQAESGGVRLRKEMAPNLPALRADARRVRQVAINLLSNAIKFTPAGGEVRVSADATDAGLVLAVADTGIGIAPEDIPTALDPFGQVDNSLNRKFAGTGLGLPLSLRLVKLHGGELKIASKVNVGTTVAVTFPQVRLVRRPAAA